MYQNYLHLFQGQNAKSQHDATYYGSEYKQPWVAFTEGYGVTFNKVEYEVHEIYLADWSKKEQFLLKELPSTENEYFIVDEEDAFLSIFYTDEEEYTGWILYESGSDFGDSTETQFETIDDLNAILAQSKYLSVLQEYGPCFNDSGLPCGTLYASPQQGYKPPRMIKRTWDLMMYDAYDDFDEYDKNWNDFYNALQASPQYAFICLKKPELEILNQFMTGGTTCVDMHVATTNRGPLLTWNGTQYENWGEDMFKDFPPPDEYSDEVNYISNKIIGYLYDGNGFNTYLDWVSPTEDLVQPFMENIVLYWYPPEMIPFVPEEPVDH